MSVKKINREIYECICELPNCPGKRKPWLSDDDRVPERCRWCGRRTWNGSRLYHLITAKGKTQRISEWARETGLSKSTIRARVMFGWPPDDAVTVPAGQKR